MHSHLTNIIMHMYAHVYKTIDGYTYTYLYFIFDIYIMLSIHQIFLLVLNNFFLPKYDF